MGFAVDVTLKEVKEDLTWCCRTIFDENESRMVRAGRKNRVRLRGSRIQLSEASQMVICEWLMPGGVHEVHTA
jgi:hypothetical protein